VIEADDGDSFIDIYGRKWTCVHGSWSVALTVAISGLRTSVAAQSLSAT
jgi:hypothetical protein